MRISSPISSSPQASSLSAPDSPPYHDKKVIFLSFIGALGDSVVLTGVFPGLKQAGYHIILCCFEVTRVIFDGNPLVDELLYCHSPNELQTITAQYRQQGFHVVDCMALPIQGGNGRLEFYPKPMHIAEVLAERIGVPTCWEFTLPLSEEHLAWAEPYQGSIMLHTRSQWSIYKNWPPERWQAVSHWLREKTGLPIYQILEPNAPVIPNIEPLVTPSVRHAAAAIKASRLLVGLDSAFNHISRALKKKSVILWGPTHPYLFGYAQNINLVNGVAWDFSFRPDAPFLQCQPCHKGVHNSPQKLVCPNTLPYPTAFLPADYHPSPVIQACMSANTAESVFTHAMALLENP